MNLTGPQIEEFLAALVDAFRSRPALALMVRTKLERNLNEITEGTDLSEVTFSLIDWAERTGCVVDLIEGAYRANAGNPSLHTFYTQWHQTQGITVSANVTLQAQAAVVFSQGLKGVIKSSGQSRDPHQPTIDRSDCITLFHQLLDHQRPHRFLYVTGGPKMGKSHLLMKLFPVIARTHNARCATLDLRGQTAIDLLNSACGLLGYELNFPTFDEAYQQWLNQPRLQAANLEELLAAVGAPKLEQDQEQRILPRLTRAFVRDLSAITGQPLVLIFDRAEEASLDVQQWLVQTLLVQLSALHHVCAVVGGRDLPEPAGSYNAICHRHRLEAVQDEAEYVRFCREVAATVPEYAIGVLAQAFNYSPGRFAETIAMQFMPGGR